ncbi:hypothetical protein WOLCODRAFT_141292 [Wolfiporia cocos MD-104 SS10]|uniref:Uncharacterized protein n=1 Tax=Wolfiporia cocos (strain MD-104) TaxID=742152 RepID=A0A2H3JP58_WOLCO|nr:hypothetical protein WOLCODRAFT_141292 [Wolfiporia cocos MD-104 SS10]
MPFSMRGYSGAERVDPDNNSYDGSLARLHEIAWRGNRKDLFHPLSIVRDAQPASAELPENPIVLHWDKDSTSFVALLWDSEVSSILVRDEYPNMLRDIIDDAVLGKHKGKDDVNAQPFYNPFYQLPGIKPSATGAILVGSPGIGKSVFLTYVLALRLLAGLTTILQSDGEAVFVLNDEGVFRVPPITRYNQLRRYIPVGTWCLIDSNPLLTEVPPLYLKLYNTCGTLILQAASSRDERIEWMKKAAAPVYTFWMAPWSLGELITGRDLQIWGGQHVRPSESDLMSFSKLYGTSARQVYAYATNPGSYTKRVHKNISKLARKDVVNLLRLGAAAELNDAISHEILVATPCPGDRQTFDLQIATRHLLMMILDQLDSANDQAVDMLYQLLLRDSCTRAGAGYLLEGALLVKFPNGGEWPVTAMKISMKGENTHRHSNNVKPQYLRLGYEGCTVAIANDWIDPAIKKFERLYCHHFSLWEETTLEDGFYIPRPKSQPTFDAFVYDAGSRRATIFQVTVADRHDISAGGLDWLHARGVKLIDLVVVTPPLGGRIVQDIWVANSHRDKLDRVYHLELLDLKECSVAELKQLEEPKEE